MMREMRFHTDCRLPLQIAAGWPPSLLAPELACPRACLPLRGRLHIVWRQVRGIRLTALFTLPDRDLMSR